MKYKTLVISPHCDDEVLGCGGAIANRDSVFVYYLGVDVFHVVKRDIRVEEVREVSEFLGFDYRIGNNTVNHYDKKTLINEITDVINDIKPNELFIPNNSYNQDHKETHDACIIALRPHDINHFVPLVLEYEIDQYLLWGDRTYWEDNWFEGIDVYKKCQAYLLHKSQVRPFRPESLISDYARIRGLKCHKDAAEGFKILRYVL
jgi:LmbE family N-acetylglucosaminyl deacetylase